MFGLSRTTVRQASAELVKEGWLYKVKSRGTYVGHPKIVQDFMRKLESFDESILSQGMTPSTEVLALSMISPKEVPPQVKVALKPLEEDSLVYLKRRRRADSIPVLMEYTYLPLETGKRLFTRDLGRERLFHILKEEERTRVFCVNREVEAVEAGGEDVEFMQYRKGKPMLSAWSTALNAQGEVICISYARYRGDYSRFSLSVYADRT